MTIEQYFKDKIDWRLFNSLVDKLFQFGDNSNNFIIDIRVGTINSSYTVYKYNYDDGESWSHPTPTDSLIYKNGLLKRCKDKYLASGIYYKIVVFSAVDNKAKRDKLVSIINNTKKLDIIVYYIKDNGILMYFKNKK